MEEIDNNLKIFLRIIYVICFIPGFIIFLLTRIIGFLPYWTITGNDWDDWEKS